MTADEKAARKLALAMGLSKVDPGQLSSVVSSQRKLVAQLPKDLHWSEESALVFRLPPFRGDKP